MAFCGFSEHFAYWMLFFTDLGQAWLQMPWMHVKLGFVFALSIMVMPTNFQSAQNDQVKIFY
jgi:putative membrane protein